MNSLPKPPLCPTGCPAVTQTDSPARDPNQLPAAVQTALDQIAQFLNDSGREMLAKLLQQDDGYPQLVHTLEKLCKCALAWRDSSQALPDSGAGSRSAKAGFSPQTEREFKVQLEGE